MLSSSHLRIEDQFKALPKDIKLVILHPAAYNEHHHFRKFLLNTPKTIYKQLPNTSTSLLSIVEEIRQTFNQQSQLNIEKINPNRPADAIANALNQHPNSLLYLDAYDGPVIELLHDFVVDLVDLLQDGSKVILSGRQMPTNLLNLPSHQIALLPVDRKRLLVDYVHPEPGKSFLEVRSFGQGQVFVNGNPIIKWEGYLPRALFFFLIDRAMTTRDEIFRTFWPKLAIREATNVFHVTKRKISEILNVNLTVYGSGFYRIAPEIDLHYDVVNFQEAVQQAAIADNDEAESLYRIAIDLYREEFLSSIDADWAIRRRDEMRSTYTDALIGLARLYERRDNLSQALGLFQRASAVAPAREDLSRSIMRLYDNLGHPELGLETYHRLEEMLKRSFNVRPDPQTTQLAQQIQNNLK